MRMSNLKRTGGVAAATALALAMSVPGAAFADGLADATVSMEDSSGNSMNGTIDINDLESGSITIKGEGDWDEHANGVWANLNDSSGNRVSGAFDFTGTGSHEEGYRDFGINFNPGVLKEGETYTFTVEYRDPQGNAIGYGEYTFTVGSSKGSGDEPSAGTGGGTGGGEGPGDGDGTGPGAGSGSGSGGSSDNSWSSGGGWGGSGGSTAPSGDTGSAGTAGTPSDPVNTTPETNTGAEGAAEPAGDANSETPEGSQSAENNSQSSPAAVAGATKGGGGGNDGPTPTNPQHTPGQVNQQDNEGVASGTVLAKLGEVYSLLTQPQKPVSQAAAQQPSFSVTGIPWLLAAMLAILLLAGPAGIASRFAGYRRGLSSSTRLGAAAPAAASSSDGTSPKSPRERRDA